MTFFLVATLLMGAAGFLAGFFGPIMVDPGANQGPLLGIFITGPLGVAAGAIFGVVLPRVVPQRLRTRIILSLAAATFVGIIAGLVFFREPEFVGRLYFAEVTNQCPATKTLPSAIKKWEDMAKQQAYEPKAGWREERRSMVDAAGGSVVTLRNVTVWYVHRQRKPWNRGRYTFTVQPTEAEREAYAAPDVALPSQGWFLVTSSEVPADWPPRNIGDFLGVVEIISAPPEIRPP